MNYLIVPVFAAAISLAPLAINAHEFWIEPSKYTVIDLETVQFDLKIGEHFEGRSYPYIDHQVRRFDWIDEQGSRPVDATTGDKPAASWAADPSQARYLVFEGAAFDVHFKDADKFSAYLKTEGLEWVLDWYAERDQIPFDVRETYYRHAKSLVRGADSVMGDWAYQPTGMLLDIVPDAGALNCGTEGRFQVLYRGQPQADLLVRRFTKGSDQIDSQRTDRNGFVQFASIDGMHLLNVVRIAAGADEPERSEGRDWVSEWGSFSFACIPQDENGRTK